MAHHQYKGHEFKSRVIFGEYRTPAMALWLMKYFPRLCKTERQAGSVLLILMGFVLLAMIAVLSGAITRAIAPAYYGAYRQSSGDTTRPRQETAPSSPYGAW